MNCRIVVISDTHQKHEQITVPVGDILIHAGDWTNQGTLPAMTQFLDWFCAQPHAQKVFIPGNHELSLVSANKQVAFDLIRKYTSEQVHFLLNSSTIINGLKFWGSPVTPFYNNWAFNHQRGKDIAAEWAKIPDDVEVLITHGPPHNISTLDLVENNIYNTGRDLHQGCEELTKRIQNLKQLKLHCFGHLHYGYGLKIINNTIFGNAAICNEYYNPVNKPLIIDLEVPVSTFAPNKLDKT